MYFLFLRVYHALEPSLQDHIEQFVAISAFIQKTGWNVIVVDWAALSKVPRYEDAVNNAHFISLRFGQWLSDIMSKGHTSSDRVQIVGFSIGAHMAGIVAKEVQQQYDKVAKIFGSKN